jgi:hypothetical protein
MINHKKPGEKERKKSIVMDNGHDTKLKLRNTDVACLLSRSSQHNNEYTNGGGGGGGGGGGTCCELQGDGCGHPQQYVQANIDTKGEKCGTRSPIIQRPRLDNSLCLVIQKLLSKLETQQATITRLTYELTNTKVHNRSL